jgi:hypothetical protein
MSPYTLENALSLARQLRDGLCSQKPLPTPAEALELFRGWRPDWNSLTRESAIRVLCEHLGIKHE